MPDKPTPRINRKDITVLIGSLTVAATIAGVVFSLVEIQDLRKANANVMSLNLTHDIYTDTHYKNNPRLIKLIDKGEPILIENGGKYEEEDLDNLLSQWDLIARLNQEGTMPFDVIYSQFSFHIVQAYENQEIQDYLKKIREENNDPALYADFEWLAKWLIETDAENGKGV